MTRPLVLFGAFDRHNFGDLLFPHVAAALLPGREVVACGLASRDLSAADGHAVHALHGWAARQPPAPVDVLHAGGEILDCTARQAAVMLSPPETVDALLAVLAHEPVLERGWLQATLGTAAAMPYVASRATVPGVSRTAFAGVGGVGLAALLPPEREAVRQRIAAAEVVTVRDLTTRASLQALGIEAGLLPDPAVMVPALFGETVRLRGARGAVREMTDSFDRGYIAVQFSAEFASDQTLEQLALALASTSSGSGFVLFRAGTAPWHDDATLPARLAGRLGTTAALFTSIAAWDLCALLSRARAVACSSLHAALVSAAFGVPAVGVVPPGHAPDRGKLAAVAATWYAPDEFRVVAIEGLGEALARALHARDVPGSRAAAEVRAERYRDGFAALMRHLGDAG